VISAVDGFLLRQMREHLDTEATVQVVGNPLFPGAPYDLRGEATGDAGLGHDVVGNSPGAIQELTLRPSPWRSAFVPSIRRSAFAYECDSMHGLCDSF
jgi:hypothetical protein